MEPTRPRLKRRVSLATTNDSAEQFYRLVGLAVIAGIVAALGLGARLVSDGWIKSGLPVLFHQQPMDGLSNPTPP